MEQEKQGGTKDTKRGQWKAVAICTVVLILLVAALALNVVLNYRSRNQMNPVVPQVERSIIFTVV